MTSQRTTAIIPGYQIQQTLGRGAMATVYLATQLSLQRQVALKVMSSSLGADSHFKERFLREGRIVGRLTHPHIVAIHDVGVTEEQQYIAMEWIPGGSLQQHLSAPMEPESVLQVIRQLAIALAYAHDQQVVHRDVKPENVLFRKDGTVVLTDFGIAKTIGEDATVLTRIDAMAGTPRYMSPEQVRGGACDHRSDIYALGVMLYEMLVGAPPFHGESSLAVLYAQVHDPVPQLPRTVLGYQPLLDAMLAKQPENRVPDCRMLLDFVEVAMLKPAWLALENIVVADAMEARPQSGWLRWFVAGLLSILLIGFPALTWHVLPPTVRIDSLPGLTPVDFDAQQPHWPLAASEEQDAFVDSPAISKGPVIPPKVVSAGPIVPVFTAQQRMTQDALLTTLKAQINGDRMSEPVGDNALNTLRIIRELRLVNKDVTEQQRILAMRLLKRARLQFANRQYATVQRTVQLGLQADDQNTMLIKLGQQAKTVRYRNLLFARAEKAFWQVDQQDFVTAFKWYKAAAELGQQQAMAITGVLYANGQGVDSNSAAALSWLRKAAIAGDRESQYNLAMGLLFSAHDDPAEAAVWMNKAATAKDVLAYRVLSWMYRTATGVESSLIKAFLWGTRSALANIHSGSPAHRTVAAWEQAFAVAQERSSQVLAPATER